MINAENLILMIEDSDEDFIAIERAFKKTGYDLRLKRVVNANQALDFLKSNLKQSGDKFLGDQQSDINLPALILLDLNLPGMDGRDLLVEIKRNDRLKQIPVIVLTTSNNPRDILHCYRHGANSYQIKSVGFEKFATSIQNMVNYWFKTVTLPSSIN
jgi:CheY-like chemotaxis protein